jgi:hypothetical protein
MYSTVKKISFIERLGAIVNHMVRIVTHLHVCYGLNLKY